MRKLSLVYVLLAMIIAATGCASPGAKTGTAMPYCPKCKVRVARHRFLRASSREGHTHVRYLCPSCGKEWSAAPDGTVRDTLVCPKCGCALKECPACCKTFKK
ncbi:MAG: hypothetical protein NTX71_08645 [Candidatus Aureabacteria bacterium]|nr:hypothetical protein [Candidatus Auribacterota bacterium]